MQTPATVDPNSAAGTWAPYCGAAPAPAGWLSAWNLDPIALMLLAGAAAWTISTRGARLDWRLAAIALVAGLYISPLCALASALFTARVVHHVVLTTVLAPLLVSAFALANRSLPGSLAVWTAVQALTFWAWHAPPLYGAALSNDAVFWLMQVSILGTATLWWAKLRQAAPAAAVLALLATMVQMGLLGALITFAGRALYAPHALTTQAWGLSPLDDQQVAGLVMWAPASAIYLLTALTILYRSLPGTRLVRS